MISYLKNIPWWGKIAIVGILVIITTTIAAFYTYGKWQEGHYFGIVVRVVENGVVITDAKIGERTIRIDDTTIIKKGMEARQKLAPGDNVIIVARKDSRGEIMASLIRVVDPPKYQRGHETSSLQDSWP